MRAGRVRFGELIADQLKNRWVGVIAVVSLQDQLFEEQRMGGFDLFQQFVLGCAGKSPERLGRVLVGGADGCD